MAAPIHSVRLETRLGSFTLSASHEVKEDGRDADRYPVSVRFHFEGFDPRWTPRFPELGAVANAVSIAMPHVEPFVIRAIRNADRNIDDGDDSTLGSALREDIRRFVVEEASHHVEHRRFNAHLLPRYKRLTWIDRLNRLMVGAVERFPAHVQTGFAAGFELLGICVAMWLAPRQDLLLREAEPEARRLFLWHLGEEVGHRSIAHDAHRASGGGLISQILGLFLACVVLGLGAFAGAVVVLITDRRWYRPVAWWRLVVWAISFLWASGPMMLATLWRHPDAFPVPAEADEWRSTPLLARHSALSVQMPVEPAVEIQPPAIAALAAPRG
jgi:predicted metal-dependent hydrolase